MLCNHSEIRKLDSPFKCCQIRAVASSPAKPQAGSFLPTRTWPEVPICRSSIQETETPGILHGVSRARSSDHNPTERYHTLNDGQMDEMVDPFIQLRTVFSTVGSCCRKRLSNV